MCAKILDVCPKAHMAPRTTKPGDKFGHLTVLDEYSTEKMGWKCLCTCGNITYRNIYDLKHRKIPSCGCQKGKYRIKPNKFTLKNSIYIGYKVMARKKKLNFDLTFEQACIIFEQNCTYCNSPPSNKAATRKKRTGRVKQPLHYDFWLYTGIDRVDSSKGYTLQNCVPCCSICNISKNNLDLQQWKDWIRKVYFKTFNDYPIQGVELSSSKQETPEQSG